MTQGKCIKCKVAYFWSAKQKLSDSYCPTCKGKLKQTTYFLKWEWKGIDRPLNINEI